MNTRPSPIETGEGTAAIFVANGMLHRICPSAAARPTTLFKVRYRYCLTPPIVAGISDECDIRSLPGFGDRQISLPVAWSNATASASPPVATMIRSPSSRGFWPAYHPGMVVLYSCTRFFCQTSLPVFMSMACRRHFGSSEKTSVVPTDGTVLVIPWLGRTSTA